MTVQRAKKPREVYDLGYLRLYREDLEAIAGIVREECDDLLIEFHDEGQHTGNEPGDFAKVDESLPERLDKLTLTGKRDSVTFKVHLGQRSAIVVKAPDNGARGAAHSIRDLCATRCRRLIRWAAVWKVMRRPVLWGLVVAYVGVILEVLLSGGSSFRSAMALGFGLLALLMLPVPDLTRTIINAPRALRPTHWQRHRLLYISNFFTLLLGGIIGYLVNQLPPWD